MRDRLAAPLGRGTHAITPERLQQEVERADLERGHREPLERRRENDVGAVGDLLGDLHARDAGHHDVQEEDVGPQLVHGADRGQPVARLVDVADPVEGRQVAAQRLARQRLVVRDHDDGLTHY